MIERYYGTLGPACRNKEVMRRLFEEGMTGVRLNLSHTNLEQCKEMLDDYFQAAKGILEKPELVIDLRGPELRMGKIAGAMNLEEGTDIAFGVTEEEGYIPVPKEVIGYFLQGQQVLLDDGKILVEVTKNHGDKAYAKVLRGGILTAGKSIALPGCKIFMPTLTEQDLENLSVAKAYGVTGVMLPFVREVQDLDNLRTALKDANAEDIRIFAKIENKEGIEKLEELIPACDEIVIARGDLGNSGPLWELPVLQEKIATMCKKHGREFMVVTQMLASMEHEMVPTRAEVSDIFRAVSEGAASIMVTSETAVGKYPSEAMKYLVKTAEEAKKYFQE